MHSPRRGDTYDCTTGQEGCQIWLPGTSSIRQSPVKSVTWLAVGGFDGINPVGMSYPMPGGMVQLPPLAPNAYAPPLNRPTVNPLITPDGRVMVPTPEPRGEGLAHHGQKLTYVGRSRGIADEGAVPRRGRPRSRFHPSLRPRRASG